MRLTLAACCLTDDSDDSVTVNETHPGSVLSHRSYDSATVNETHPGSVLSQRRMTAMIVLL